MTSVVSAASGVGAGVSQGRFQGMAQSPRLKDQGTAIDDIRSAALQLLQSTLSSPGATGRDLDVLA